MAKKILKVTETFSGLLKKMRHTVEDLSARQRLRVVVFNKEHYFDLVEWGYTGRKPVGMVRKSMPEIEAFIQQHLVALGPMPTDAQIDQVATLAEQFALDRILPRTPIGKKRSAARMKKDPNDRPGRLRRGFQVKVVRE